MENPNTDAMKRVAMPMVIREEDWPNVLDTVMDHFSMEPTAENRALIMDVITECEKESGETYDQRRQRQYLELMSEGQ